MSSQYAWRTLHQLVILALCRTETLLNDTEKKGSPRDVRPIGITLREKNGFSEVKCFWFFFSTCTKQYLTFWLSSHNPVTLVVLLALKRGFLLAHRTTYPIACCFSYYKYPIIQQ